MPEHVRVRSSTAASRSGLARWVAIFVASLSAISAFAFVFAYPLWSLLLIVLDIVVSHQLAVHCRAQSTAS